MCSIRVKQGLKSFIAFSGSDTENTHFSKFGLWGEKTPHWIKKLFFFYLDLGVDLHSSPGSISNKMCALNSLCG